MIYRVIVRSRAGLDMEEAGRWYEFQRPGLGEEFLQETKRALESLKVNPDRRAVCYKDFRRLSPSDYESLPI